jgi:hypothetical protein
MLQLIRQRLRSLNYQRLTRRATRRAVSLGWQGLRSVVLVADAAHHSHAVTELVRSFEQFGLRSCVRQQVQRAAVRDTLCAYVEPGRHDVPPKGRYALVLCAGWASRWDAVACRQWVESARWIWVSDLASVRALATMGIGASQVHVMPDAHSALSLPGASLFVDGAAAHTFYVGRFLLSQMVLDFDAFWKRGASTLRPLPESICLGVIEYPERLDSFMSEGLTDVHYFPGLRHNIGWIGCGLSYKFLMRLAMRDHLEWLFICEDDVQLPVNWRTVIAPFTQGPVPAPWAGVDIFSGLITDLPDDTRLLGQWQAHGVHYAVLDQMTGMVCNVYRRGVFEYITHWNESLMDLKNNAIDRYIPRKPSLQVALTVPFLAGHKEGLSSTLWKGASNAIYINRFEQASQKVDQLIQRGGDHG